MVTPCVRVALGKLGRLLGGGAGLAVSHCPAAFESPMPPLFCRLATSIMKSWRRRRWTTAPASSSAEAAHTPASGTTRACAPSQVGGLAWMVWVPICVTCLDHAHACVGFGGYMVHVWAVGPFCTVCPGPAPASPMGPQSSLPSQPFAAPVCCPECRQGWRAAHDGYGSHQRPGGSPGGSAGAPQCMTVLRCAALRF